KTHSCQRYISRKNHQISPGYFVAIFLFDRPEQPAGLIEAYIIRPTVQRGKTLLPGSRATTAIVHTVSAGDMPCHTNEQATIMAKVCRPPVLRIGHECMQVFFNRFQVEAFESFS